MTSTSHPSLFSFLNRLSPGFEAIEWRSQSKQIEEPLVFPEARKVRIVVGLRTESGLDLDRSLEVIERLLGGSHLRKGCSQGIEQIGLIRAKPQGLLEEVARLGKITDVQGEYASIVKFFGIARRCGRMLKFLFADLNVHLRAGGDFDIVLISSQQLIEHFERVVKLAAIENLDGMFECAQGAGGNLPAHRLGRWRWRTDDDRN